MAIDSFVFNPTDGFNNVASFPDPANEIEARTQLQSLLDQLRDHVNTKIKDVLNSKTDGASGADNVAATAIVPGSGETTQAIMEWLYTQIVNITLGQIPDGSIGNTKLATDIKVGSLATLAQAIIDAGANTDVVTAINKVLEWLNAHLADIVKHITSAERDNWNGYGLNSYASSKDANGIYTVMDYKRADGTIYMKSTLSGGTSPNYTTDTWQFYDTDGTTLILTKTWTLTYDADGKITSKVVS